MNERKHKHNCMFLKVAEVKDAKLFVSQSMKHKKVISTPFVF